MHTNSSPILLFFLRDDSGRERLRTVATTPAKMKQAIVRNIHSGSVQYTGGRSLSKTDQIKQFRKDWNENNVRELNKGLSNGYIGFCSDGKDRVF